MARAGALLLDLDGTLADTAEANFLAYRRALGEAGVVLGRTEFDRVATGRNWRQFLPVILSAAASDADPATVAARKQALYPDHLGEARINGALVKLAQLVRPAMAIGLVTTASADNAAAVLARHGITDLFDTIVSGDDVMRHKPDPEAYLLASMRLGVAPETCVAFEDTDLGAASAEAAGMTVVRVRF